MFSEIFLFLCTVSRLSGLCWSRLERVGNMIVCWFSWSG